MLYQVDRLRIVSLLLLFLVIKVPTLAFGAEGISKGKWKGIGEPSVAPIKISFRVINQANLDSIKISYHTTSKIYIATKEKNTIGTYRNFFIIASGDGITVHLSGAFSEDGITVKGTVSIFLANSTTAGISWSGSFEEPFTPPYLIADFMSDKIKGMKPLLVQFTDLSLGDIINWHWNFGDGYTSDIQNPFHTYETAGDYAVTLIVMDSVMADTLIRNEFITVSQPMEIDYPIRIIPTSFYLSQNYPNPFNSFTHIDYSIPNDCNVRLEIYNTDGQKITTLVDNLNKSGIHSIIWKVENISSGVYVYKISADNLTAIKKCILLK